MNLHMRKLHFGFLVGFLTVLGLCGVGTYLLHRVQMGRNASSLLDRARSAEAGGNLLGAEESLGQYLSLKREDSSAWTWFARITDERTKEKRGRERVFLVNEEALRKNPDDRKLERRCAELAIELERHNDARRHLIHLNDAIQADPDKAAEAAELEDLLGQCDRLESKFDEAERHYRKSIALDRTRVVTFDRLGRLLRQDRKNPEAADRAIEEMLKANPKSALAHVNRWRYRREFGPAADSSDIAQALKLGPDEAEVLIAAAEHARQSKDLVGARKHIDGGLDRHPKTARFYQLAADLDLAENHADRAEAVLRRGIAAVSSNVLLKVLLAETLISENKLDGEEGAISWIERLRRLGLADGYVLFLEGQVAMAQQKWHAAISRLDSARGLLAGDPAIVSRINLLLAGCHSRTSESEKRVAALERAASGEMNAAVAGPLLAQAMESQGRLDEAIRVHTQLLESRPESRLDLIRLLIRRNLLLPRDRRSWEGIERRFGEAEKALPNSGEDLVLLRADLLRYEGKPKAAKATLEQAIQQRPRSVRERVSLATLLQDQNDIAGAVKVLDQAEIDLGLSSPLLIARVAYWTRIGGADSKKALDRLSKLCKNLPAGEQPLALNELASSFYRLGDLARAAQLWGQLSKLEPQNLEVLSRLADLALGANDRSALEETVKRITLIEGGKGTLARYYEAAFLIGEAGRGDPETAGSAIPSARRLVDEILELRGDWWGGLVLRGRLAELAGKPEDAVRDYLRAIDLGAMQPEFARRSVALLYRLKQFDQIDQVVQRLTERGMALDELKLATALNALRGQNFDRAVTLTREVIPESSKNYFDLLFLSRVLLAAGRTAEAEKPLKRALELAPGVPDVWVSQVQFLIEADRKGEIQHVLNRAAGALPTDQATRTLALCQTIAGHEAEAGKLFQSALDLNPGDAMTLRLAAEYYVKVLKLDKAEPLIAKLLDPKTKASPADVAWANRAVGLIKMSSGDQRQIDAALALVDQNLKANPYSFDDQRARAVLLTMKPKRRDEGVHALEALDRSRLLSREDRFLLAQLYRGSRDWPKCRDQMLGLLGERNRDPNHLANFVNWVIEQNDLDQAERWLQDYKPTESSQSLVLLELKSRLLKARGRGADLFALLRRYSEQHPDQLGEVCALFERYGFTKEAEQAYRAFAAQEASQPARIIALIGFLSRQHRDQEALALCEQARKTCPPQPLAAASLAVVLDGKTLTEEQRHRVVAWLEDAVRRHSNSTQLRLNLAMLRSTERRYDQAESIYREVLGGSPNNLEALNNLAWLLAFQAGMEQEALDLIDRAIEIAGSDATLLDTRAVVFIQLGKPDPALESLRDALSTDPQKAVAYFHLARAYQLANNQGEARKALQRAEELGFKPETIDPQEQAVVAKLRQELALLVQAPATGGAK